jgi:hypothetical protein
LKPNANRSLNCSAGVRDTKGLSRPGHSCAKDQLCFFVLMIVAAALGVSQNTAKYQYFHKGVTSRSMGGGKDIEETFQWMRT